MRHRGDKRRKRGGSAAVELAVCLMPLMFIVLGTIESGRLMMAEEILANASREGARLAALGGSAEGSSSTSGSNEVNYRVRQNLFDTLIAANSTITITDLDNGSITDLNQASAGDRIQVAISVPYKKIAWFSPWFFGTATLSSSSVMRKEAP